MKPVGTSITVARPCAEVSG